MLRQLPNLLTILRLALIAPFVWCLTEDEPGWALGLFTLAGFTDALDGFLAERYDWRTWLGGVLDPVADKALLISAFLALGWAGLAPWWLVALVLLRDAIIVAGAVAYHFLIARFSARPSLLSKANTLAQLGFVFLVLADSVFDLFGATTATALLVLVCLTTVSSGLHYVVEWGARAWHARRGGE